MNVNRREALKSALAFAVVPLMPSFALAKNDGGFFELTAQTARKPLHNVPDKLSELWTYNGELPGPKITITAGERVKVRFKNMLDEPTSVHWHGIRIDNAMDGVAGLTQEPVMPGDVFDYDFIAPDAGTYWYHAHNMSWNQVPRGLAGPLIIQDKEPMVPDAQDITMVLSDWILDENGQLNTAAFGSPGLFSHGGQLGNWLTVNGVSLPDISLTAGKWHRLRLINASSARVLDIDPSRFGAELIGYDGQTFLKPVKTEGPLRFAPAQRMDLIVKPKEAGTVPFEMVTGKPFTFANFIVLPNESVEENTIDLPQPNDLPLPEISAARLLPLVMVGGAMGQLDQLVYKGEELSGSRFMETKQFWGLNGVAGMEMDKPYFTAKRGETIMLESENQTAWPHAMHIHGHHFQVLEINGEVQESHVWRDTFLAERGDKVRIAFVADNPGKWLIHCHMLGHAASGMMNWFEVV